MSGFESFRKKPEVSAQQEETPNNKLEKVENLKPEQIKDSLFDEYLKQQLIEDFFHHLGDYMDEEAVDAMRSELANHDDKEVYATLSLPHELRERKFESFQKMAEEQGVDPKKLMHDFIDASKKYGFGVGYHTSPNDIKPNEKGQWSITGFENDHRDDDLSKAYYSTKYRHLFKKRDPKFIYIVRTDPETHRTDGNWSRAGMLSVVTQVPFADVVNYVEQNAHDILKKKADASKHPPN